MHTLRSLLALGIGTTLALGLLEPSVSQTTSSTRTFEEANAGSRRQESDSGIVVADSHQAVVVVTQHHSQEVAWSSVQESLAPMKAAHPSEPQSADSPQYLAQARSDSDVLPVSAPLATSLRSRLQSNQSPATGNENLGSNVVQDRIASDLAPINLIESDDLPTGSTSAEDLTPAGDALDASDEPAPDYLTPEANPLTFPTQPSEVKIKGIRPISLQQALQIARRNSETLEIAKLQLGRSQAALREAQALWYPQLTLSSSITRQQTASGGLQARRSGGGSSFTGTGLAPGIAQLFQSLFSAGGQGVDDPSTSFNTTVEATYSIYTAGRRSATVRLAEKQLRAAELEVERIAEQLRLEIATAYYDLQESDENIRIATDDVRNAEKSLQDAEALERAGLGTKFDVLQAEVELANSRQTLTQRLSEQRIARRDIARQLNLPQTIEIVPADSPEKAGEWELSLEQSIILAFKNRAELEQLLLDRESSRQRRRIALSQVGPQVDIFGNYSLLDLFEDDENFADGYAIGVRLSWLFFDGGAARAAARQEEKNQAIAEQQFSQQRNNIRQEVEESYYTLEANEENIQTATKALEQAREALRLARLRFQAGVGIQLDVLDAQAQLTRAQGNLISAVLGYNRALASLQRAISNLPDSDLSDLP